MGMDKLKNKGFDDDSIACLFFVSKKANDGNDEIIQKLEILLRWLRLLMKEGPQAPATMILEG